MIKKRKYPKVEVRWLDAVQESGTRHIDDPLEPVVKTTIGYLCRDNLNESYINLFIEQTSDDPDELLGVGCIPRGMIIEIKRRK